MIISVRKKNSHGPYRRLNLHKFRKKVSSLYHSLRDATKIFDEKELRDVKVEAFPFETSAGRMFYDFLFIFNFPFDHRVHVDAPKLHNSIFILPARR